MVRYTLLAETSGGQGCYFFGQVDHWSDVPPGGDNLWPNVLLLQSGWLLVKVPLGRDILWPSVLLLWLGWLLIRCIPWQRHLVAKCVTTSVRLTSGQSTPWQRHLVAKCVTTLVRLTADQMYPLAETSCGQVCYFFGQVDHWSDVPPGGDNLWPNVLLLQSGWLLVKVPLGRDILWPSVLLLWLGWLLIRCIPWQRHLVVMCVTTSVRLISSQMYPLAETSYDQVCYYFSQADLWSDIPPSPIPMLRLQVRLNLVSLLVRLTFGQIYTHHQTHL